MLYTVGIQLSAEMEVPVEAPDEEIAQQTARALVNADMIFDCAMPGAAVNVEVVGVWKEGDE